MFENLGKTEERLKRNKRTEKENFPYTNGKRRILQSILVENKELIRENYILGKNEPLVVELSPLLINWLEGDEKYNRRAYAFVLSINDELRDKGIRVDYILKRDDSSVYVYLKYEYEEIRKIKQKDNDTNNIEPSVLFILAFLFALFLSGLS